MSYDFYAVDPQDQDPDSDGWVDPYFDDTHPAFSSDGAAGTVMLTERGYARCGNYTSNVSGMWANCLTAALEAVPEAVTYLWDMRRFCEMYPEWLLRISS